MLRFGTLDVDLAAVPSWLPIAVAAGSLGYAIYLALMGRAPQSSSVTDEAVSDPPAAWPSATDRRYFESELQLAISFVDLARTTKVHSDAVECRVRATEIHTDLASWTRTHGGEPEFERSLERLLWLIESVSSDSSPDF